MIKWFIENNETQERRNITELIIDCGIDPQDDNQSCEAQYLGYDMALTAWPEADPANLDCYAKGAKDKPCA